MNDSDQRARRNSRIMGSDYDSYKLMSREDEEERYYARQQRENDKIDKEEYLADMKEADALTNPKEEVDPKKEWCLNRRELTEDEQWDLQEKMHAFQKQQRWEQDVEACWKSTHGRY